MINELFADIADDMHNGSMFLHNIVVRLINQKNVHEGDTVKDYINDIKIQMCYAVSCRINQLITARVPRKLFEQHVAAGNTTEEALWKVAIENTEKRWPLKKMTFSDLLLSDALPCFDDAIDIGLTCITNSIKLDGASVLLYESFEKLIKEEFKGHGVFVIPSSVHEILVFEENETTRETYDELNDFIRHVNQNPSCVKSEDVLSNQALYFKGGKR